MKVRWVISIQVNGSDRSEGEQRLIRGDLRRE